MEQFEAITGRNLKLYFRDRGAVFFSLLSMLVVICLMVFFLGDMNIENITELLGQFPGRDVQADRKNAELTVLVWTCAGILSINAVTVTLAAYSVMIKDKTTGKLNSIYTAPVSRTVIAAGYVAAAWVDSVLVCGITLFLTEAYCVAKGLAVFPFAVHMQLLGMILLNSFVYAAFMYVPAVLVKTEGAWSGLGTVVGTLVGFLGGIYIPVGALSDTVGKVMKCTPVLYGASMFRKVMTGKLLDETFFGIPDEILAKYRIVMGIDLEIAGRNVGTAQEGLLLFVCGGVLLAAGVAILKYGKRTDR